MRSNNTQQKQQKVIALQDIEISGLGGMLVNEIPAGTIGWVVGRQDDGMPRREQEKFRRYFQRRNLPLKLVVNFACHPGWFCVSLVAPADGGQDIEFVDDFDGLAVIDEVLASNSNGRVPVPIC
jgi:hypothetical protein